MLSTILGPVMDMSCKNNGTGVVVVTDKSNGLKGRGGGGRGGHMAPCRLSTHAYRVAKSTSLLHVTLCCSCRGVAVVVARRLEATITIR